MLEKLKKINNKNIIDIVSAFFIFLLIEKYVTFNRYNVLDLFFIGMCYFFCSKITLKDKKNKKDVLLISFIFATLFQTGNIAMNIKGTQLSLFREFCSVKELTSYLGTYVLFYKSLCWVYPMILNLKVLQKVENKKNYLLKGIKIFFILLLFWMPYYLICYPGLLSPDSIYEFRTVITNFEFINNAHPVLHTIFVSFFFNIGKKITNDINFAVAFVTLIRLIIQAGIISYGIIFLNKRNIKNVIINLITVFYAIVPIFGAYGICMWKDIIFSNIMLLFVLVCWEMIETKKVNIKLLIKFFVMSLLIVFLRNNAIYMYFLLIPIAFYYFRGNNKKIIPVMSVVIIIYYVITGPVFEMCNVQKSNTVEYLGVPIQHISRMAYKNVKLNEEEEKLLDKLMPIELIKSNYTPGYADPIKFHSDFNQDYLNENKEKYLKLYLNLFIKNPHIAVEEQVYLTTRYWYPNRNVEVLGPYVQKNDYGIFSDNLAPDWLYKIYRVILSDDTLIFTLSWSGGLYFWLLIISFIVTIRKKKKLFPYWVLLSYLFTLFIGAPVSTPRYFYCFYIVTPILFFFPYLGDYKNNDNK